MSQPSPGLALAWRIAASEAALTGYPKIECPHLLMGLLSLDKGSEAALTELKFSPAQMSQIQAEHAAINKVFEGVSKAPAALRRALRVRVRKRALRARGLMSRSAASKAAFAQAAALAKGAPLNSLHLLSVLLALPDPAVGAMMRDHRLGPDLARKAAVAAAQAFAAVRKSAAAAKAPTRRKTAPVITKPAESLLARFGRDLTAQAVRGAIGPIFGRQKEVLAVLQSLSRFPQSHPLLVGEAGVGKAAIVEALALRGASGKDAPALLGKRIVELNLRALKSGTEIRGELEKRMKALLDELKTAKDVILFVDDIHAIVGGGRSGSGQDAGALLKPALARGDFRVIGATTVRGFRETIERDPGLSGRFEKVDVPEPSLEETMGILRGLKPRLEKHHGVRITDEAIHAAASLSVRFDPDHRLPNKAVDLLGRAAALSRSPASNHGGKPDLAGEGFVGAMVDARAVAEVLAEKRGLPIETVTDGAGSGARLLKLEAHLKSKIVGQDEAVARVAARVNLAYAGVSSRSSPLAVFLLLGPSGVGKTELARCLARFLFDGPGALSLFEMTDFAEEGSVFQLVGSPPGARPAEPAQLVDAIRRNPHSVIVFDDVDKAHRKVLDILLQLCDTGRLSDAQGRVADARQVVVVMTGQVGFGPSSRAGFDAGETVPLTRAAQRKAKMRKFFGAELLGRIDEIITLRYLDEADVRRIARPLLARLVNKVRKTRGVFLRFEPQAEALVIRSGFNADRGVGDLKQVIERLVENPLSSLDLAGKLSKHPAWKAVQNEGGLDFLPE